VGVDGVFTQDTATRKAIPFPTRERRVLGQEYRVRYWVCYLQRTTQQRRRRSVRDWFLMAGDRRTNIRNGRIRLAQSAAELTVPENMLVLRVDRRRIGG